MTFSLGASGTVDAVKHTLTLQVEQYAEELVGHVNDLVHKVLDTVDAPHGVVVGASGHTDANGTSFSVTARPLTESEVPTAPPPASPQVS